ncbi:hypothetical protein MAPG_05657 [Magnaporthiopsis poae ATCC 64411]|uniref:Amine oxidase n=1 Tax=Magnaporthiopsis poae (strain ATCC 64411 / 73-15) TaxID=644358 RepID=A0A0C4DZZ4_MAGP6|nr:hypothetical protein MAPG_05657 [Magnaporthiopsis poae ATCC 64411]
MYHTRLSIWLLFAIIACLVVQVVYARPSGGRGHAASHGRRLRRGQPRPQPRTKSGDHAHHEPRQEGTCGSSPPASIKAPKRNLWGQLNEKEVGSVVDWLFQQRGLNLTHTEDAGDWDNTIISVEVMRPNKSDALSYIDGGGPMPAKFARVTLDQRATENAVIAEVLVGPLPISPATASWSPLAYPFTKNSGGRIRNLEADTGESLYDRWLYRHTRDIMDITKDLFNGTVLGRRNDTLEIWGVDPLWQEDGRVRRWDTFWNLPTDYSDAQSLLPTGLFLLTDVTGRDPSRWRLEGWLYNGIFYNSTAAFRTAYWTPGFEKLGVNVEGDWARTDHQGPTMPLDNRRPPVLVAPSGSRFSLDPDERYVEWMGFSFYLGFTGDTGVSLHDVRFEGERVLYELGLQEALSHYAGNDPVQSGTAYLDDSYGFGATRARWWSGLKTRRRTVALFEAAADHALQRHSTDNTVSATRNTYFVVRQIATVANYDYTVSYTFTLSGEVAVDVRASGFKDAEPWLSHAFNGHDVADPLVDFSRFAADDESLLQEDVVLWLNLGMHHVPVKEDLPNTLTTTAHSSVRFVPSNFRDTDASRRTVNMARITYRNGKTTDVVVFGQSKDVCSPRLEPDELGLWSYGGSSAVHTAEHGWGGSSRGRGREGGGGTDP